MLNYKTGAKQTPAAAAAYASYLTESSGASDEQMALSEYYLRTEGAAEAVAEGMKATPQIRAGIDPELAKALKLPGERALTKGDLANLLSGSAVDGSDLPGSHQKILSYRAPRPKSGAAFWAIVEEAAGIAPPDAEEGKPRDRIAYYDFTVSAPKSVSLAWAFAGTEAERASILQAHHTARDEMLRYVEKEIARAHLGHSRQGGTEDGHLAWMTFDHFAARPTLAVTRPDPTTGEIATELYTVPARNGLMAGDPQLHSHCIVPNLMRTESGRFIAINGNMLAGRIHEFGSVYQMILARELRKLGMDVDLDAKTKTAKMSCIPEHVVEEFSKRTRDAEATAKKHFEQTNPGKDWDDLGAQAKIDFLKGGAKVSRRSKVDDMHQFAAWAAQAARIGWKHVTAVAYGPTMKPRTHDERLDAAQHVTDGLFAKELEQRAVLKGSDARTAAAQGLIAEGGTAADVSDVSAITANMAKTGVVQDGRLTRLLWKDDNGRATRITTELHASQEREVITLAQKAVADRRHDISREAVAGSAARLGVEYKGAVGDAQREAAFAMADSGALGVFVGVAGVGKAQPDDAKVLTPTGFRRMGDLAVGDLVTCPDGAAAPILGIYPQGEKDIHRVIFEDGRTVECCDEHLWKVWTQHSVYVRGSGARAPKKASLGWRVAPLHAIRGWFDRGSRRAKLAAVPLVAASAVELPPQNLPIPPYALGALLGDGNLHETGFVLSTADQPILERVSADLPDYETRCIGKYDHRFRMRSQDAHRPPRYRRSRSGESVRDLPRTVGARGTQQLLLTHAGRTQTLPAWAKERGLCRKKVTDRIVRMRWSVGEALGFEERPRKTNPAISPVMRALAALGLKALRAHEKFVPAIYKAAPLADRVALLQGLMDTEGSVEGKCRTAASFTSTSERLARDVQELAWSFGAIAKIEPRQTYFKDKLGRRKPGLPSWRVRIIHPDVASLFSVPRKVSLCGQKTMRHRLRIVRIEPAGRKPARCIAVAHPDQLYVADDYVVTHNTSRVLPPLVKAWQDAGHDVWGTALGWKQSRGLHEAGIDRFRQRALQPLLNGLQDGSTVLTEKSIVVVDELSLVGTRQLLDLLRHRERIGFKIVATGDEKQMQSIEAGPVVELLRRALGAESIPEILTTVRQRSEVERETATMWREGRATEALGRKRTNGTAELVPGGYSAAIQKVATLAAERRATNAHDPDYTLTISVPTNADAHAIGLAVREARRAAGEIKGPDHHEPATDGAGNAYSLPLAEGERVRLFAVTRAIFTDPTGRNRSSNIGDNGTVLDVTKVMPGSGLRLRNPETGKEGFVSFDALRDPGSGRIKLALGEALTVNSSQGLTSDEHIFAMPSGSKTVQGFMAYVGSSRHRVQSWIIGSMGAEMRDMDATRPIGVSAPASAEDAAWEQVGKNLSRQPLKESALAYLEGTARMARRAAEVLQSGARRRESSVAAGKPAPTLRHTFDTANAARTLAELVRRLDAALKSRAPLLSQMAAAMPDLRAARKPVLETRPPARPMQRVKVSEADAQRQLREAMRTYGLRPKADPIMDGKLRPVAVDGDKGNKMSGAYKAFYAGVRPAAVLYNYKQGGFVGKWKADGELVPMSTEDSRRAAEESRRLEAQRTAERANRENTAAQRASWLLEGTKPADPRHPYLVAKGVRPNGIRQDLAGNLVIPLYDIRTGQLRNLQTIMPDGAKLYLAGAQKNATAFVVGAARKGDEFGVAEGFATAATVHELTGKPVAMVLDTSNMGPAVRALREANPVSPIFIAADNDHHLPMRQKPLANAGLKAAEGVAGEVNARIVLAPELPERAKIGKGTDWNDHAAARGAPATAAALRSAGVKESVSLAVPSAAVVARASLRHGPRARM